MSSLGIKAKRFREVILHGLGYTAHFNPAWPDVVEIVKTYSEQAI